MNVHLSYLEEENERLCKTIDALNKYIKILFSSNNAAGDWPCDYCMWEDYDDPNGPCDCCDECFSCWQIDERKVIDYVLCKE